MKEVVYELHTVEQAWRRTNHGIASIPLALVDQLRIDLNTFTGDSELLEKPMNCT